MAKFKRLPFLLYSSSKVSFCCICQNLVTCYISSAKSNRWTPVSPLNIPRHQLGVTELNGRIFAVGGSDGAKRLNTVEYFNPKDDDWKYAKSLTTCRSGVGVCTHSGFLYSFGGYDGHICLNSVEKYDPELDIWINIPPMNIARSFPGMVLLPNIELKMAK